MNVYDFDKTIYDGDSSVDFFKFCCRYKKQCISIIPGFLVSLSLYILKFQTKEQMKSSFFRFVKYLDNQEEVVKLFWETHRNKIKEFYIIKHTSDDIVISASPEFLLKPICNFLDVKLIATRVCPKTGQLIGNNCYGTEKVIRLREFTKEKIDEFYSDSLSDFPLRNQANKAFLVKGNQLNSWDNN